MERCRNCQISCDGNYCSIWMLKHIYFAFVHSLIIYCIELYANTCRSYLEKLIKLNNKLLQILQNKPLSTPVFDLYLKYNTLPIPQLHIQHLLLFVHKFVHHPDALPAVFIKNSFFITNSQVHNYSILGIIMCKDLHPYDLTILDSQVK